MNFYSIISDYLYTDIDGTEIVKTYTDHVVDIESYFNLRLAPSNPNTHPGLYLFKVV